VNVAQGAALTLSGSDSTDPDGQIASYLWSSGETTESMVVNTTDGHLHLWPHGHRRSGAKGSSSVSVVVAAGQSGDSWYFRGTPNNWGSPHDNRGWHHLLHRAGLWQQQPPLQD
jgi:hypothetical protein